MKQSTKLLSLVLALLLAFSCMSVIGSATLVQNEITYDTIDDAALSYEQVADLTCDLLDELLADADIGVVLDTLGLKIDLSTIDTTFSSLYSTSQNGLFKMVKGLLGDIGNLDFSPLKDPNTGSGYQRANGDYRIIAALIDFVGCTKNAGVLSKAAYGIGTSNGISLGSILGGMLDLGEIQTMLADIPSFLVSTVYDLIVHGSYGYPMSSDDIKDAKSTLTATYPEMDTIDEMVPNVIYNLLTKPQEVKRDTNGDIIRDENGNKVWDMNSVIMPNLALTAADINPLSKSLFQILDVAAQIAIDEIGVPALNNNLKKALMDAVEADFNEIDYEALPADVKTVFDNTDAYVTYFAYDKLMKSGGVWYYTTLKREPVLDSVTGEPTVDEKGNAITQKIRKYYKVNMGAANEFASLINWDWEFVTSDVVPAEGQTALVYDDYKAINGSLVGALNNILGTVYDVALTDSVKADFVAKINTFVDDTYTGWATDPADPYDNANININVEYILKYVLTEFGDKVFGVGSKYANYTMEEIATMTIIDIVAMIGPDFFEDAMPQIILPKNADGSYAFHKGVQLWEFAAVVIRELMTGIAPVVNYDAYIFANGDVTSANDRQFVEQGPDEWMNIILNMGTDLGIVYLQQITNIQDFLTKDIDTEIINKGDTTDAHWIENLNLVIEWALDYIGGNDHNTGVLAGLSYNAVTAYAHPFDRISYILNTLLPLGFVGDGTYTSSSFDLDASLLVEGVKSLLTNFDLTAILSLFGRNQASSYNLLDDASVGTAVLDLVNDILALVFGNTLLQGVNATGTVSAQSVDGVITQANLKTTIYNLLTGLNTRKDDILKNGAPVLAKFIQAWGGEQKFKTPSNDMGQFVVIQANGSTYTEGSHEEGSGNNKYTVYDLNPAPITVNVKNNSQGVWRHYRDAAGVEHQDEQYQIEIASVEVFESDGTTTSKYVSNPTIVTTGKIPFGGSGSFTFNVGSATHSQDSNVTAGDRNVVPEQGALARFKIGYKIYLEDGKTALLNGKIFYDESYVWLSRYAEVRQSAQQASSDSYQTAVYSPVYVPYDENVPEYLRSKEMGYMWREHVNLGSRQRHAIVPATPTVDGITMATVDLELLNKNSGDAYETTMLRLFDTYTAQFWNQQHTEVWNEYAMNGSVPDWDTFKTIVTMDAVRSEAGRKTVFPSVYIHTKNQNITRDIVIQYYDAEYYNLLNDLVDAECELMRDPADYKHYYNASATVVLDKALENQTTTDEAGKEILKETNFGTNAEGVTVINCAQAWTNYYTALQGALRAGLQPWNPQSVYNFKYHYDLLRVAVNDIERCFATEADGAATLGADIDAAEVTLKAAEAATTDIYNYTDYKMYRINKYNDARKGVQKYIDLKNDAEPTIDQIDQYFDYNWMEENDFLSLIDAHTVKFGADAGTSVAKSEYYNYLVALLKTFDEKEITSKKSWLDGKKVEYARTSELDLAMAVNYLNITEDRLLKRDCGVITSQLDDEIASAQNMIGTSNGGRYTDGSWANYIKAYNDAVEAVNSGSQKQVFDAKYQLLVQRKRLVEVGNGADYAELNALIANAEFALANPALYESKIEGMSMNKILGMVLAELGMDPIVNENGNSVQLFPGSAYLVVDRAYSLDDQKKVDNAAKALKEALARLTFKGLEVKEVATQEIVGSEILVEDDIKTTDVNEQVTALVSHIGANQYADAVKTYFTVNTSIAGAAVDEIVVTNDIDYSVSYEGAQALEGFAGTNSTVTFYTTYNGVKLPVATVKIVVDGDINGDGAVDVLDAAYGALVAAEKDNLRGCYLLAGDLSGNDREVKAEDYQQIVAKVVA